MAWLGRFQETFVFVKIYQCIHYDPIAHLYEEENSMKQDPPPETLQDGHKQSRLLSLLLSFQLCFPVTESAKYK